MFYEVLCMNYQYARGWGAEEYPVSHQNAMFHLFQVNRYILATITQRSCVGSFVLYITNFENSPQYTYYLYNARRSLNVGGWLVGSLEDRWWHWEGIPSRTVVYIRVYIIVYIVVLSVLYYVYQRNSEQ